MREFFKGWRRKVGCATLMMAVGIFCIWVRSTIRTDTLWMHFSGRFYQVHSSRSFLWWESRTSTGSARWKWFSYPTKNYEDVGHWTHILVVDRSDPSTQVVKVAYWPFVVMPSLLASYLLLCKARKAKGTAAGVSVHFGTEARLSDKGPAPKSNS